MLPPDGRPEVAGSLQALLSGGTAEKPPVPRAHGAASSSTEGPPGCPCTHIVTDRSVGKYSQANTEEWLARHQVPYDTITCARDKTVVGTDAFIDDKSENVVALREAGSAAFLLRSSHNRRDAVPSGWVVDNWGDFVAQVGRLASPVHVATTGAGLRRASTGTR